MYRIERLFGSIPPELDCGPNAQTAFICDEAVYAQSEGLSATHLAVAPDGSPVAFITLAMASVRFEAHERPRAASLSSLPALLIAQLGVATSYQRQGVGARLVQFAAGIAQSLRHSIGCRYLVVDCLPPLVPYYERLGFAESKGEKRRRKADIQATGRVEGEVAVRLALDVSEGRWYEAEHAPPHLFATEVHRSAADGDIALLESLLKAGVPADLKSGRGDDGLGWGATALHVAASRSQVVAIRTLLSAGADINAFDGDLETPLHWAVRHGQEISVAALLVAGANPNIEGGNGVMTPLAYALHGGPDAARIAGLLHRLVGCALAKANRTIHASFRITSRAGMTCLKGGAGRCPAPMARQFQLSPGSRA